MTRTIRRATSESSTRKQAARPRTQNRVLANSDSTSPNATGTSTCNARSRKSAPPEGLSRSDKQHLLRRLGFLEIDEAVAVGVELPELLFLAEEFSRGNVAVA